MQNICITISSLDRRGIDKQCLWLAKALQKKHKVLIVVIQTYPEYEKHFTFIQEEGIEVQYLSGSLFKKTLSLKNILRERETDAVFSFLPVAIIVSAIAAKLAGVNLVFGALSNCRTSLSKRVILKYLHKYFLTKSISNSYINKEKLSNSGFDENKIRVIPNVLTSFPARIYRPDNEVVEILSVSGLRKEKDFETALKTINHLRDFSRCRKTFHYTIVGSGKMEKQIRAWISAYNLTELVDLHTDIPNPTSFYNKADIYLCTSKQEGLSSSIIEAMSHSMPIVATDVGDNRHLVINGFNGYLTDSKAFLALSEALHSLLLSPIRRREYGANSYTKVMNNYSPEFFEKNYNELINEYTLAPRLSINS